MDTQPLLYLCVRCGNAFSGPVCPYCRTPLGTVPPAPGSGLRAVGSVFWSIGIVAFLILLVLDLAVFVYTAGLIVTGALEAGPLPIDLFLILPFLYERVWVSGPAFVAYFGLIAAGIVGAYAWFAYRDTKPAAQAFVSPIADARKRLLSRSAWISVGQVFMATLFFQFAYVLALELAGFVPATPTLPGSGREWYLYYALANASVYEEIVSRWLLIGVPLFLTSLVYARVTGAPDAFRSSWRHLFGGTITRDSPRTLGIAALTLVVFSSILFGLAHVPGWGWWKFLPSAFAGVGMGYLFVRRGLLAGILFHFVNDYMTAALILAEPSLAAQALIAILILVTGAIGLFFFAWYIIYGFELGSELLVRWGLRQPKPSGAAPPASVAPASVAPASAPVYPPRAIPAAYPTPPAVTSPPPPPPPPPPPGATMSPWGWVSFTCPRCGWREGRYDRGRFTCLRCGTVT